MAGLTRMRSGQPDVEPETDAPANEEPNSIDEHGDDEAPAAKKPKAKKPVAVVEPEPEAEAEAEPDEEPAAEPEADPEVEVEEEPEEPVAKPDPELERRSAQLRKQEQRQRERLSAERAEITKQQNELAAERKELAAWKAAKARAKYDPVAYLKAADLSDDDMEPAAKFVWAHTKKGAETPGNAEAAARLMREREAQSKIDALQARLDKLDEEKTQAAKQQEIDKYVASYISKVEKAAKPGTIAAHYIGKGGASADKTRTRFKTIAHEIMNGAHPDVSDGGEEPTPAEVLSVYEKLRREELEDDGVDVAALLKRKPVTATAPGSKPAAGEVKKPAAAAPAGKKPVAKPVPGKGDPLPKFKDSEERNSFLLSDIARAKAAREIR
jgi:hypothetical protein